MNREGLAARLLATFVEEMHEQLRVMGAELLALEAAPGDAERIRSLFRVAHTLKGAARAAGVPLVEETCHVLETLLANARDAGAAPGADEMALLFAAADALSDAAARLAAGGDLAGSPLATLARRLNGPAAPGPSRPPPAPSAPAPAGPRGLADAVASAGPPPQVREGALPSPAAGGGGGTPDGAPERTADRVRVPGEKLDSLFAAAGQLLVASGHAAARPEELYRLHDSATRRAAAWRRDSRRLRLELQRAGLWELARDAVEQSQEGLDDLVREAGRLAAGAKDEARALARLARQVGESAYALRLRPFAEACEALPRVVRDVAAAGGKRARLEISGGEVEADRAVIDGVREAILHLVRNAVDHGIEGPDDRERAGKPPVGRVAVSAALRGDRIVITVEDDGAGLDAAAVRAQLARRGLPVPGDERELGRALFEAGFSTRAEVTAISGRGVGLDVARDALARIRGGVDVAWRSGGGTTFVLDCPLTLATARVLLVRVGTQLLAVPTTHVQHLHRIRPEEIRRADGRDVVTTAGAPVPVVSLARTLGPPLEERAVSGPSSAVRLEAGGRRLVVVVDELLSEEEVVVRPLEGVRTLHRHFSGAAILGTGRVALVLDAAAVIASGLALGGAGTLATPASATTVRRILVVDDSITTRTLEQGILEAAGYAVRTAVDGAEGWRTLQEEDFDLVVSDVEMPRMDGFALCESMRRSPRHRDIPVVLVTALEAAEHRARGLEAGADAYVVKSSFDQRDLLDTIRQLIGDDR